MNASGDNMMHRAVEILRKGEVVALTGAGVSVDSGIPDFRSASGLWVRFDPMEYAHIDTFRRNPKKSWELFRAVDAMLGDKCPNAGHRALAELEDEGRLDGLITQNIDGLHLAAGSREVVHYHGTASYLHCIWCGARYELGQVEADAHNGVPYCRCQRQLKPAVTLFGEVPPPLEHKRAMRMIEEAQAMLLVGTSATVEPAASFPRMMLRAGKPVIEINLYPSSLSREDGVIFIEGSSTTLLPELVAALG